MSGCLHVSVMEFPDVDKKKAKLKFGKIWRFFKKKFADLLRLGRLALYMPKPDKTLHFNALF